MESTFTKCEHPNINPPYNSLFKCSTPCTKCVGSPTCKKMCDLPPQLPNRHQSSESLHCRRLTKEFDIKSCVFPILANMQVAAAGARVKVGRGTGEDRAIQDRTMQNRTEQDRTEPI